MKIVTIFFSVIFVVGCASEHKIEKGSKKISSNQKKITQEGVISDYKGILVKGFETFYFKPYGQNEKWWVNYKSVKAQGWEAIKSVLDAQCKSASHTPCRYQHRTTKMRGKAIVSKRGKYGHLGRYPREIMFTTMLYLGSE